MICWYMLIYLDMLIRCYLTFPSCPCLLATLQPPACSVLFHMAEAINCNAIFLACLYIIFSGCPSLSSPAWLTGIPIMDSASPSASWVNWAWQAVAIRPSGFPDQVSPKFCWLGLHLSPQLGSHLCWDDEGLCWPWEKGAVACLASA